MSQLPSPEDAAPISRRRVLALFGGLGVAAVAGACGDSSSSGAGTTAASTAAAETTASTATATAPTATCILSPEQTEGPFYLEVDKVRRDITEGRPGVPLTLAVTVVDVDACAAIRDAAVDVWHCDAAGAYSGVQGTTGTFLRGIQMTGADGVAELDTIYPGWYQGRAVHVHVKVHLGSSEAYTGQLYFDDAVTDTVYEREPYAARPGRDTRNANDGIFSQGGDETLVALARVGDGYRGTVTLGIRRA